ncbi:tyrosinase-like protein [Canariomyces notabilis]|uniref:Tyrosinase-like protein n=1 Tax=Canariomyces notabilis TaxID=2074819 RepID=A0AAN6TDK0_9PEZI|nr:tyrosinase-like protein [Canariomyces arenarius]
MMLRQVFTVCLTTVLGIHAISIPQFEQFAIDSGLAVTGLNGIALVNSASKFGQSCNPSNVKVRREWRTLSKSQRREFIAAVKCLASSLSILAPGQAAGAKSLFDDFVFVHMNQTMFIHNTGNFLTWHRYFIHVYEQKLQACGYRGTLPYWDWGFDAESPRDSPVFDGSDTSLGSDGEFVPHPGLEILFPGATEPIVLAPGTGGGCVFAGPFANFTIRLGPISQPDPTADNSRCLKRDMNADSIKRFASFRNTTDLIVQSQTIQSFQTTMEGDPRFVPGSLGVHGGGHFAIGGDPGSDPFISPGDPAFYLHHSQIDRVYWIWQMLDFENRQGVFGTNFMLDLIPSANTTVDDIIDLSPLAGPIKIKELMNTVSGSPLCYVYL